MLLAAVEMLRMEPLKTSLSKLMMIFLTSNTHSAQELRTLADCTFQRLLLAVRAVRRSKYSAAMSNSTKFSSLLNHC